MEDTILERLKTVMNKLTLLASDISRKDVEEIYEINFHDTNNGNKNIISYWNIPKDDWDQIKFTDTELDSLKKLGWRVWTL